MENKNMTLEQFFNQNRTNRNLIPVHYNKEGRYIPTLEVATLNEYTLKDLEKNYQLALEIVENRKNLTKPTTGDCFVDSKGEVLRMVYIHNESFQFCHDGSFSIGSKGHACMSGGFCDINVNGTEVYSINPSKVSLKLTNKIKIKKFWFFMNHWAGANRALYFDCPVKVWKLG